MNCLQEGREALLEAVGNSEELVAEVLAAMKHSMGQEISAADFENIHQFAQQVQQILFRGIETYKPMHTCSACSSDAPLQLCGVAAAAAVAVDLHFVAAAAAAAAACIM